MKIEKYNQRVISAASPWLTRLSGDQIKIWQIHTNRKLQEKLEVWSEVILRIIFAFELYTKLSILVFFFFIFFCNILCDIFLSKYKKRSGSFLLVGQSSQYIYISNTGTSYPIENSAVEYQTISDVSKENRKVQIKLLCSIWFFGRVSDVTKKLDCLWLLGREDCIIAEQKGAKRYRWNSTEKKDLDILTLNFFFIVLSGQKRYQEASEMSANSLKGFFIKKKGSFQHFERK